MARNGFILNLVIAIRLDFLGLFLGLVLAFYLDVFVQINYFNQFKDISVFKFDI